MFGAWGHHAATEADSTQVDVDAVQTPVASARDLGAASITRYRHLQYGTVACDERLHLYNTHTCSSYKLTFCTGTSTQCVITSSPKLLMHCIH